jgi:hypothetical protein
MTTVALSLTIVGIIILIWYMISAGTTLTENSIAGVWRIATSSTPAYIVFDHSSINLMEEEDSNSMLITGIASDVTYNFKYKVSQLCNNGSPYYFEVSIPKTTEVVVQKYSLDKIFVSGGTVLGSLNPCMGILIATPTNGSETLQLIKDNELSIEYLSY